MLTDAQRLYMEEVLGLDPRNFRAPARPDVVVLTPELHPEERALLGKILASLKLARFTHVEGETAGPCRHLLHFADGAIPGRSVVADGVRWGFPNLNRMLGDTAEVTALKREVWTLLQDFRREEKP